MSMCVSRVFFFNDTATTEIYTLSLHDALPICRQLHTVDYRSAEEFRGQHVVVVGGGASATQLLGEISRVTSTTWVTRRPPGFRGGPFEEDAGRRAAALEIGRAP